MFTGEIQKSGMYRKPAGLGEQVSVVGLAGAVASWVYPHAEAWSPGFGQVAMISIMGGVPIAASIARNLIHRTLWDATKDRVERSGL